MPAADRVFVDTNILVYGQLRDCALFDTVGRRLAQLNSAGSEFWISRQVLREYLAVMSRQQNLTATPPMTELLSDVQFFCDRYRVAEDGPIVTKRLVEILEDVPCGGNQIHDANIVATMLASDVKRLLTYNVQDFRRFSSFIAVEPLVIPSA